MRMAPFPSPVERTVASALLLLSTATPSSPPPPPPPPPHLPPKWPRGFDGEYVRKRNESKRSSSSSSEEESLSFASSGSKSTSSSLTSKGSSKEIRSRNLRVVAVVARCHDMKLKVFRRKRSHVSWSSGERKVVPSLPATVTSESTTTTEASCLSSNSSAASSARSRFMSGSLERSEMKASEKPKRRQVASGPGLGPTHLRRRADGILKMLSGGCFSEVRIRQVLGDSPDTSKALRMLLKQEEIKRSGTGGRQDPYIYTISREPRELGQQY